MTDMNLTNLKELIFEYGGFVWNDESPDDSAHELQAHAEYYVSEVLNEGLSYERSQQLLTELMSEYGYLYPLLQPGGDDPRL